ncbi:MAG: hypothetical protein RSE91_02805, partial [Bacilli bacterium]
VKEIAYKKIFKLDDQFDFEYLETYLRNTNDQNEIYIYVNKILTIKEQLILEELDYSSYGNLFIVVDDPKLSLYIKENTALTVINSNEINNSWEDNIKSQFKK